MRKLLCLSLLVFVSGCASSQAIVRTGSMLDVKTKTAKKEFEAAPTDAEKAKIAKTYFDNADQFTQVILDYMQGKKPSIPDPSLSPGPSK